MSDFKNTTRYPDNELNEFKELLESKLEHSRTQLENLKIQIIETSENTGDDYGGDWVDDSSNSANMDMLNNMALRQQKYIQELTNALMRIENKVYGICIVSGELIDKRRLLAVPTTTKSLDVKTNLHRRVEKRMRYRVTDNPYVKAGRAKAEKKNSAK